MVIFQATDRFQDAVYSIILLYRACHPRKRYSFFQFRKYHINRLWRHTFTQKFYCVVRKEYRLFSIMILYEWPKVQYINSVLNEHFLWHHHAPVLLFIVKYLKFSLSKKTISSKYIKFSVSNTMWLLLHFYKDLTKLTVFFNLKALCCISYCTRRVYLSMLATHFFRSFIIWRDIGFLLQNLEHSGEL